jgi:hypothetical protein
MTTAKFGQHSGRISRGKALAKLVSVAAATAFFGPFITHLPVFGETIRTKLELGDILYVDSGDAINGGCVIKIDPITWEKTVVACGGYLRLPLGVIIQADGTIIVSDSGRLIRIDAETGVQTVIGDYSHPMVGFPCHMGLDGYNGILVANLQAIVRVDLSTGETGVISAGGSLLYPLALTVGGHDELYVLNMAFPPEIVRVNPRNGAQKVISSGRLLNSPQCIARIGADLFVTDVATSDGNFGIGRVIRINCRNGEQSVVTQGGLLVGPVGITVDSEGQLIVGDPYTINPESRDLYDGGIIRIDPATGLQSLLARGEGSNVNPRGVAIFGDDSIGRR